MFKVVYNRGMEKHLWEQALAGLGLGPRHYYGCVGSTNDVAERLVTRGAEDLTVIIADEQEKGRGRHGRDWYTPPGAALAVSVILDPESFSLGKENLSRVTGLGALAVAHALRDDFCLPAAIKWPNDVLVEGKKVCGTLVESHWKGDQLTSVVLGMGINIKEGAVPRDKQLHFPAASLEGVSGRHYDRPQVLSAVMRKLVHWYPRLNKDVFLSSWEDFLAYRKEHILLRVGEEVVFRGKISGLGHDGSLRVRNASGKEESFEMGEIQLRPVDR